MADIDRLFHKMVSLGASDLHLSSAEVPMVRASGSMARIEGEPASKPEVLQHLLFQIMPEANQKEYEACHDTDFAYAIVGLARFRANIFMDRKGICAVFRQIPETILTADQLNLPPAIRNLCFLTKGLVVVTGPTGSGKSTTLAAMIDLVNKVRDDHIITIEDPIEFVHPNQKCLVNQREVHNHTKSFKNALRGALREDPDIMLIGEMRDLETIEIALETAETGHLVFGTLHTSTAASTVERIVDQFPAVRQSQIRTMLASSLKGVVAQTLCKKKPKGRIAALEVLIVNSAVSALIRDSKTFQIESQMQIGAKYGMVLLNDALLAHVLSDKVSAKEAYMKSVNKDDILAKFKVNKVAFNIEELQEDDDPHTPAKPAAPAATASAPTAPAPQAPSAPKPMAPSSAPVPPTAPSQSAPVAPPAPNMGPPPPKPAGMTDFDAFKNKFKK